MAKKSQPKDEVAKHLPGCPKCSQPPAKFKRGGFWLVGCWNDRCPHVETFSHICPFYAERRWRRHVDPWDHYGMKLVVDSDFFPI